MYGDTIVREANLLCGAMAYQTIVRQVFFAVQTHNCDAMVELASRL